MTESRRVRFSLENFGPIRSGSFELRPLTIFIGPNNTGKSYAATLAYMMVRVLPSRFGVTTVDAPFATFFRSAFEASLTGTFQHSIAELTETQQRLFDKEIEQLTGSLPDRVQLGLWSYFRSRSDAPLQRSGSRHPGHVRILDGAGDRLLEVVLDHEPRTTLGPLLLPRNPRPTFRSVPPLSDQFQETLLSLLAENTWRANLAGLGINFESAHYLPSARSGILAGWPLFASVAIDIVRGQIGLQNVSVPPLAGTVGDFVQTVIRIVSDDGGTSKNELESSLRPAIDVLERTILNGRIEPSPLRSGSIDLDYVTDSLRLPVQRASAMVGEVAPLALVMQQVLRQHDLLVIDEPEAHLHPANQRRIARVLARLAAAGVTVIAPTHSSTIIHQLGNLVRASLLTSAERVELGLEESDRIMPEDIGVYAFHSTAEGIVLREVVFDPEFGFPEEEFLEVAESLSHESYWIDAKLEPVTA